MFNYKMLRHKDDNMTLYQMALTSPPSGWIDLFNESLQEIELISNLIDSTVYFPLKHDVFKAFDLCPMEKVKVIILGQDPYHSTLENGVPQANGLAFSTNKDCPIQPSLKNIYVELLQEGLIKDMPKHGDLSEWAQQGVLLLNTCLTVAPHKPGSHKEIWNGFITRVINKLNNNQNKYIYLLLGEKAKRFDRKINQQCYKLYASHPSPFSAHKGFYDVPAFIGCNHFKKINEILISQGLDPINWTIY